MLFVAGLAFPLKETDPEFAALRLGNFIFGGGTLSSRLGNRIRQKEGLSYGVTATSLRRRAIPQPRSPSTPAPTRSTSTGSKKRPSRS